MYVPHAILSRSVKFCRRQSISLGRVNDKQVSPSDAKTVGLSSLEGSVKQKTSANPSDAACRCGANDPVTLRIMLRLTIYMYR
jgi:hypothetical protein